MSAKQSKWTTEFHGDWWRGIRYFTRGLWRFGLGQNFLALEVGIAFYSWRSFDLNCLFWTLSVARLTRIEPLPEPAPEPLPRHCTDDEINELSAARCPNCRTETLLEGPQGGLCMNVKCATCGSEWNTGPLPQVFRCLVEPQPVVADAES